MSQFSTDMETALDPANPTVLLFGAIKIEIAGGDTIRLLDGAAELEIFSGETFVGRDATYGALGSVEPIEDGFGDEAPVLSFSMDVPTKAATATLSDPAVQGSRVRVWLGAWDKTAGAVISEPMLLQDMEIDVPTPTVGKGSNVVDFDCVSSMERFFDQDEGFRLSDADHQRVWPGELGLTNMVALVKKIYWGVAKPSGAAGGGNGASVAGYGFGGGNLSTEGLVGTVWGVPGSLG